MFHPDQLKSEHYRRFLVVKHEGHAYAGLWNQSICMFRYLLSH